MVLADTGEDAIAACSDCAYAANLEMAESKPPSEPKRSDVPELERVSTPGRKSVADVTAFLKKSPKDIIKTLIYQADRRIVAVLVRGDHEINDIKLKKVLDVSELQLAPSQAVERVTGAPSGFAGPLGLRGLEIWADFAVQGMSAAVVGANRPDAHLLNVVPGRDFTVDRYADLRNVTSEDPCPRCGGRMEIRRGIEVGHVFLLGSKYSEAMGAMFLDKDGSKKPFVMGCFGIGIGRTAAAAVEQHYDEKGIRWPETIQVHILPLNVNSEKVMITAELIYGTLVTAGVDVLLDDREERAGVKFNDADLIGIPVQVIVGEKNLGEGALEWKERRTGKMEKIPTEQIIDLLKKRFSPKPAVPVY
jgi:prolyl-tRNA synthetase